MSPRHNIQVSVETEFLADQSDVDNQRWVFAYHITIRKKSTAKGSSANSPTSPRARPFPTPAAPSWKPKSAACAAVTR